MSLFRFTACILYAVCASSIFAVEPPTLGITVNESGTNFDQGVVVEAVDVEF